MIDRPAVTPVNFELSTLPDSSISAARTTSCAGRVCCVESNASNTLSAPLHIDGDKTNPITANRMGNNLPAVSSVDPGPGASSRFMEIQEPDTSEECSQTANPPAKPSRRKLLARAVAFGTVVGLTTGGSYLGYHLGAQVENECHSTPGKCSPTANPALSGALVCGILSYIVSVLFAVPVYLTVKNSGSDSAPAHTHKDPPESEVCASQISPADENPENNQLQLQHYSKEPQRIIPSGSERSRIEKVALTTGTESASPSRKASYYYAEYTV